MEISTLFFISLALTIVCIGVMVFNFFTMFSSGFSGWKVIIHLTSGIGASISGLATLIIGVVWIIKAFLLTNG